MNRSPSNPRAQAVKSARIRYLLLLFAVMALLLIGDQTTKQIVVNTMEPGQSIPVWGETLEFTFVQNQGGAFGTSIGSNMLYIIVSLLVIAFVVFILYRRLGERPAVDISIAAMIGGAIGNLIDRFRFGSVVDFLDVDIPDIDMLGIQMQRWPVFNVADIAITVGIIIVILNILFAKSETVNREVTPKNG